MPRRSAYEDDYDYDDEDYEDTKRGVRRLRKEPEGHDGRKKWDQDRDFDRDHDYDERR